MEQYTIGSLLNDFISIFYPNRYDPQLGQDCTTIFNLHKPKKLEFNLDEDKRREEAREILGEEPSQKLDEPVDAQVQDEKPATFKNSMECLNYIGQEKQNGTELGSILDKIDRKFYSDPSIMTELIHINPICIGLASSTLLANYDFMRATYLNNPEILAILEKSGEKLEPEIMNMFYNEKQIKIALESHKLNYPKVNDIDN